MSFLPAKGPVYVTAITNLFPVYNSFTRSYFWTQYVDNSKFPNSPDWQGYQDDMSTGAGVTWYDGYGMRMEALFVAPATGNYVFRISCDDLCMFNMGTGETEQSKRTIIDYRIFDRATSYLEFE